MCGLADWLRGMAASDAAMMSGSYEVLRRWASEVDAARASTPVGWQPIETAPKDGRTLLLGYFNTRGKWRALRGQWISADEIAETWEDDECAEGWYETSVECEADVSAWPTNPTHWQPIAAPSATPESPT
jgi:hypothetical protein